MNVTKYEHACLSVEDKGMRLIIDPGMFTTSLQDFTNICAIIVTHQHQDHMNLDLIDKILSANPDAIIYTVGDAAIKLGDRKTEIVKANESELCGEFHLSFFGGEHATIHSTIPVVQNVGVMINDHLYYPGDSLITPNRSVKILALPAVAPWMKISDTMDFLTAVKPELVFPTHNALLSEQGHSVYNTRLGQTADEIGAKYTCLEPGQTLGA